MKRLFTNFFFILVTLPVEFISNISLKRKMSKQNHNNLLTTLPDLKAELFLSYKDMKFEGALINTSIGWYELASYNIEEKMVSFRKSTCILTILSQFINKIMKNLMQLSGEFSNIKAITKSICCRLV